MSTGLATRAFERDHGERKQARREQVRTPLCCQGSRVRGHTLGLPGLTAGDSHGDSCVTSSC